MVNVHGCRPCVIINPSDGEKSKKNNRLNKSHAFIEYALAKTRRGVTVAVAELDTWVLGWLTERQNSVPRYFQAIGGRYVGHRPHYYQIWRYCRAVSTIYSCAGVGRGNPANEIGLAPFILFSHHGLPVAEQSVTARLLIYKCSQLFADSAQFIPPIQTTLFIPSVTQSTIPYNPITHTNTTTSTLYHLHNGFP